MSHTDDTNRFAIDPKTAAGFGTGELRENFLLPPLFVAGRIQLHYTNYDRMIVGGAMPTSQALALETIKPAGTDALLARRELIAVNIGGAGAVVVDGERFLVGTRDMVYAGLGTSVTFESACAEQPAKYYLLSAPAHMRHPTRHIGIADAKRLDVGAQATSNERSIFQFIHPEGAKTCQLVVGMTTLAAGSVWNTMPCHVHDRRMEAYLYFDLPDRARVVHLMGEPDETRHLIVANEEAILSPGWSIHSGVGTSNYTFIWAMAGDNVDYTDVDLVAIEDLK
ncbi:MULTISPECIES: 5-dehydro-4-deoxy-D-glucuronate isomerase [Rhizobium]|uniref:4-deoxy-L-threo-5-hexosulose-uronate ketol-isomerase n=1 Tax=Rhizobium favelukesii TaxID=348824 RepID=W6S9L2_9HYPH|nr:MULTISPECIES: 5-dehydro-4-deoxy-D-glucuronate isomerase [Rhizobium]MCA0805398.1 5-dehydro-4-deoxy-D-glucuronate isomerase [Rhizobium sp. T1473]MCS0461828.1 5-dehydro-4-deoxy-D-glucuronate isomerase [Rhizobium favelukesii]UFS79271.1 5-dehydro-4-deoxy-D-glucuronate isomerase [Rhizobium sp. T136]CDM62801.1 4-deoxy-L-threo-5-hexosulose-uronate ketol-isomerase 2 [Rhizobium favelukesii]